MNHQHEEAAKFLRLAERDLIAYREQFISKIHDLLRLVELVEEFDELPVSESILSSLAPYAATMRYDELEYVELIII